MNTAIRLQAKLAVALLAVALCDPVRPAWADATAKVDETKREQLEQQLKAAQDRMEAAAQEMAELSLSLNGGQEAVDRRVKVIVVQRPMLGMSVDMGSGSPDESSGVHVISVTPGGPAEAAGIHANDQILSLNGTPLRGDGQRSASHQLRSVMKAAKAGVPMPIEYRREGKAYQAQIVPKEMMESHEDLDLPPLPELLTLEDHDGEAMPRMLHYGRHHAGGFGAVEMVDLSPALGSYFGTDKGLLVVRAPSDQRLKLQDGDVLLDIDGRVPSSAGHALQILASYRDGETVRLHILRQMQRQELSVQLPEP